MSAHVYVWRRVSEAPLGVVIADAPMSCLNRRPKPVFITSNVTSPAAPFRFNAHLSVRRKRLFARTADDSTWSTLFASVSFSISRNRVTVPPAPYPLPVVVWATAAVGDEP